MGLEKTLKNNINNAKGSALKSVLAESLKDSGNQKLADVVNQARNWEDAVTQLNVVSSSENLNSMVGNLFGFIAKQVIHNQKLSADNMFGWNFRESEEIAEGSGISIVEVVLNGAGTNQIVNYQNSSNTTGEIALGSSFSNSNQINYTIEALPFQTATFGPSNNAQIQTPFFITINKTIPVTWEQFSTLSAIKASKLIEAYYQDVDNAIAIYKYSLGNLLFNGEVVQNGADYTNIFTPQQSFTPATAYTNVYNYLQEYLLPNLMKMRQVTSNYNAYGGTSTNNTSLSTASVFSLNGYNFNASGYNSPVLNNGNTEQMTIYMSPKTSATILSVLNLPNFKDGNSDNLDIVANRGVISSICGIKVKVTGSQLYNTPQSAQGTTVTPLLDQGQVLPDGQIWVVSDDYLTFSKLYENVYTSDVFGNAMIKTVRAQLAYIPICKPWKNGAIFNGLPMTSAQLPVYTSTATGGKSSS